MVVFISTESHMDAADPPPSDAAAAITATTATLPLSESEIPYLFRLLSDDMLLHDPSRGTRCRNRCSGCAYLDPTSSDFACDEYTAAGGKTTDAADEDGDPEVVPPPLTAVGSWREINLLH